jgi:hypothetical protein
MYIKKVLALVMNILVSLHRNSLAMSSSVETGAKERTALSALGEESRSQAECAGAEHSFNPREESHCHHVHEFCGWMCKKTIRKCHAGSAHDCSFFREVQEQHPIALAWRGELPENPASQNLSLQSAKPEPGVDVPTTCEPPPYRTLERKEGVIQVKSGLQYLPFNEYRDWFEILETDDVEGFDKVLGRVENAAERDHLLQTRFWYVENSYVVSMKSRKTFPCAFQYPFVIACVSASKNVVKKMVDAYVDVTVQDNRTSTTAILSTR